ncbi:MAG TPA: AAA family ATPase [Polyangiaceae bacterium]|nr:AAA family ATPase [Polyangiaceae bacterium]
MPAVERIRLQGFKSIREAEIELGALNVLIGENGAGKSNLLSFFRMMNAIVEGRFALFVEAQGGASALLHRGRKVTPRMVASVSFPLERGGANSYGFELTAVAPDRLVFADEIVTHRPPSGPERKASMGGGHRESELADAVSAGETTAKTVKWSLDRWRFYHFHDTSESSPMKQHGDVRDDKFLRGDGSNLAAFLYRLQREHLAEYRSIRDTVRMAAPFFDDFVLEPPSSNATGIDLEWREKGSDAAMFAQQLSDGTLRFIALATLLLQPDMRNTPQTILVDEPELGLHPYAITVLASLLRQRSATTQIVLSTQSVTLLDELDDPASVIVVEREGGQSVFRRPEPGSLDAWLDDYSLGEIWQKNLIGGRPRVDGR